MNLQGAVKLGEHAVDIDPYVIRDLRAQGEETGRTAVSYIGVPHIVGYNRSDGSPVWSDEDRPPGKDWVPEIRGAAGVSLHETFAAPIIADEGNVTLSTTMKALWGYPLTQLPANILVPSKTFHIKAFGKVTTDGTAGNYVAAVGYGSSDAPTSFGSGATVAGTVSQTNISWILDAYMTCRTRGGSGTSVGWGLWMPAVAVLASTLQPYTLPASAMATATTDTTVGTNSMVVTLQRSGAGVWTAATQAIVFSALN
jgi:hypothetical protein